MVVVDDWEREFREWIRANEGYLNENIAAVGYGSRLLEWYRAVFAQNGAMPGPLLAEFMLGVRREVFLRALEVVRSDVRGDVGCELQMELEERFDDSTGAAGGVFLVGNILLSVTEEDAVIEVAEIMQGEVMDMLMRVWPNCPLHNAATYAELVGGTPVWWCRRGSHVLREIGNGGVTPRT